MCVHWKWLHKNEDDKDSNSFTSSDCCDFSQASMIWTLVSNVNSRIILQHSFRHGRTSKRFARRSTAIKSALVLTFNWQQYTDLIMTTNVATSASANFKTWLNVDSSQNPRSKEITSPSREAGRDTWYITLGSEEDDHLCRIWDAPSGQNVTEITRTLT